MKLLRTAAERIFLGKNSAHLGARFEYHLLALIVFLLTSAVGSGLQRVAELREKTGQSPWGFATWFINAGHVAETAALVTLGYVFLVSAVLVILGFIVKDSPDATDATA